jgi:hypothetical protein
MLSTSPAAVKFLWKSIKTQAMLVIDFVNTPLSIMLICVLLIKIVVLEG